MTDSPQIYRAGTLTYTKPALAILICWLFWGDFCYTVMESVTGPIMQLKFEKLGASNASIGLFLVGLPTALYSFLNPVISFKSDRFRSRWGRRLPFIMFSLPFLILGLVGLAFGDQIAAFLQKLLHYESVSLATFTIGTYAVLLLVFTFFNTFLTSVFWYLFNDVVPEHLLARFMSWFRAVGQMSTAFYQIFVFPHSRDHSTLIFLSAAVLYLVGFGLMCWNVREGQYPLPEPYVGGKQGPLPAIVTFVKGTHAFTHYWYLWLCTIVGGIGNGAAIFGATAFGLYYFEAIGLDLQQIGWINGSLGITVSIMTLGAGWLADRFHPIRVVLAGTLMGLLVVTPSNLIWLFWHPTGNVAFWVMLVMVIGLVAPSMALGGMWDPPLLMRLFPRSQYGQFCSTNAVWRSVGGMLGAYITGKYYLDYLTVWVGREKAYLYLPLWSIAFSIPSFLLFLGLYLSWKKHGGDEAYIAPVLQSTQSTHLASPVVPEAPALAPKSDKLL